MSSLLNSIDPDLSVRKERVRETTLLELPNQGDEREDKDEDNRAFFLKPSVCVLFCVLSVAFRGVREVIVRVATALMFLYGNPQAGTRRGTFFW